MALEGVGFDARFLNGSLLTEDPTEPLDEELRLVIFAPRMSAKRRKAFLEHVRGTAATAGVPVLELVTASATSRNGREELVGLVAWPCPTEECLTEELEREIEAALLNGADPQKW